MHQLDILLLQWLQLHHGRVEPRGEARLVVEHVGDAAGHAGCKVAPRVAEHHDAPAGHVLAGVVPHAFHNGMGPAIAHGEALAGQTAEVGLPGGGPIEHHVAHDDVLLGGKGGALGRVDDQMAAAEALARVIVGVPRQRQRDAPRQKRSEALAGGAAEPEVNGVVRQAVRSVQLGKAAAEHGARGQVGVADGQLVKDRLAILQRGPGQLDQLVIQHVRDAVILFLDLVGGHPVRHLRLMQEGAQVQSMGLPVFDGLAGIDHVHAAHHLVDGAEAQLGHEPARLFGHEGKVARHVLRCAGEGLAQARILGGDAHRARVEVAHPHHDAPQRDEGHRGKSVLLGPQQGGDHHVAAGLELAVGLHADAPAQIVEHEGLLGFGQPQLPGRAGVLDGAQRRGAGASLVSGDQHGIGLGLGDPRGHGTHARLGNQFDRHVGVRVGVLQVEDELLDVLDGVDVVMGRGRDQGHARRGEANAADVPVHLVSGKLAAFPGLGPLGDLDLQLPCVDQVVAGDAEPP